MFARFLPKAIPFFELLRAQNGMMQEMAVLLISIVEMPEQAEPSLRQLSLLEEKGDGLNRDITRGLSQTFITPIDREDIHAINLAQERCVDAFQTLGGRLYMGVQLNRRFPARMMIRSLKSMVEETASMLLYLSQKRDISGHLKALKDRKNDCEMLLAGGVGELQDTVPENFVMVRELVVWSQLYDRIEASVDLVSDLADMLEQVAVKYV